MNRKNKKGISPVVATVIIVAIAIALAIAVALWASGLVGIFTRFEEVKVVSAYAELEGNGFNVTLALKNTGSADATIDNVIINGKPFESWTSIKEIKIGDAPLIPSKDTYVPLKAGDQKNMNIKINDMSEFHSGQTLDIKVHTAAGHDYAKAVVLP
jgi:flagellin-like protein